MKITFSSFVTEFLRISTLKSRTKVINVNITAILKKKIKSFIYFF